MNTERLVKICGIDFNMSEVQAIHKSNDSTEKWIQNLTSPEEALVINHPKRRVLLDGSKRRRVNRRKSSVSMSGHRSSNTSSSRTTTGNQENNFIETAARTLIETAQAGADALLTPLIHRGFSEAYQSFRINLRASIVDALEKCDNRNPVELYFTGHSLGGALATIAALDTQFYLNQTKTQTNQTSTTGGGGSRNQKQIISLKIYTFGAPRVGNHPFAKLVNKMINDSWRVCLDGDPVPAWPKCWLLGNLYKHAKHQALIDVRGNIIIDPLNVENLLHNSRKINFSRHNLDLYLEALSAADGLETETQTV